MYLRASKKASSILPGSWVLLALNADEIQYPPKFVFPTRPQKRSFLSVVFGSIKFFRPFSLATQASK
jgi:hypothetical protein